MSYLLKAWFLMQAEVRGKCPASSLDHGGSVFKQIAPWMDSKMSRPLGGGGTGQVGASLEEEGHEWVTELSAPVRFIPVKSQVKTSPWAAWYLSPGYASYIIYSPAVFSFADVYLQSFLISHPPHILILRFYFWLSSGFVLYYSSLTLLALLLC